MFHTFLLTPTPACRSYIQQLPLLCNTTSDFGIYPSKQKQKDAKTWAPRWRQLYRYQSGCWRLFHISGDVQSRRLRKKRAVRACAPAYCFAQRSSLPEKLTQLNARITSARFDKPVTETHMHNDDLTLHARNKWTGTLWWEKSNLFLLCWNWRQCWL